MFKKFLWLVIAVVFLCSPLWAADKDTPQTNYWMTNPANTVKQTAPQNFWTGNSEANPISPNSQVFNISQKNNSTPVLTAAVGDLKTASPTDLCPFTAVCYGQTETEVCLAGFPGGVLCSYQDPSLTCPVPPATCPAYPFEVKTIYVKLCNPGPDPCDVQVFPAIAVAKDTILADGTVCHVPGATLCTGPMQTIVVPPNSPCQVYAFPLNQPCCVDSDYFACVDLFILGGPNCQLGVCTDLSCQVCCDYWDSGVAGGPWDDLCLTGGAQLPGNLAIWTDGLHSCQNNCPGVQPDTGKNHYKTWRVTPITFTAIRQVKDQFMTDTLDIVQLEYLSNPVRKVVFGPIVNDTTPIVDFDDHLTWYRAFGRDTLLRVEYVNQFESTKVEIDSVKYLLLPAQKDGHLPPDSVDHYKAYRIRNPQLVNKGIQLEDQFDRSMGTVENVTSFLPVFFLTPCQKNLEPTYDMVTHYVAYLIPPMNFVGQPRQITDQFFPPPGRTIDVFNSQFLLVPTRKLHVEQPMETCCYPFVGGPPCGPVPVGTCVASGGVVVPACLGDGNGNGIDDACDPVTPPDTLRNHFKTWRIFGAPKDTFALVRDQFTIHDFLVVDSIAFLSNPVRKVVFGAAKNDTSDITRPDDHLTWYRVKSSNNRRINVQVTYVNQFESTKVFIDTVKYFLLPTQKLFPAHNPPDTLLGHYTAYRIHKPKAIKPPVELLDQFDVLFGTPERLDSLKPVYFFTPADKDNELRPKSDTHYVAYEIFPKTFPPGLTTQTIDQWGLHGLQVRNSEYLLVPSRKDTFVVCTYKPNDCNGDGVVNLADIICDVNVVFKGFPIPVPKCRCDSDCNGVCNLVDIVYKKNYVFGGGPQPVPCKECCKPLP